MLYFTEPLKILLILLPNYRYELSNSEMYSILHVLIRTQTYIFNLVKFLKQFYFNELISLKGDQTVLIICPLEGVGAVHGANENLTLKLSTRL